VAISALPPLNGFVSKWLMYLSLLKCGFTLGESHSLTAFFAISLLALIGGLGVITFVRLTGIVLLGSPRSEDARHAHESSPWMLGPILVLLALCLVAAVVPQTVVELLNEPLTQLLCSAAGPAGWELDASEVPLYAIGNLNSWTLITFGIVALLLAALWRTAARAEESTWVCGYIQPTERMQYTGRSFAELFAEHLLPRFLRPHTSRHAPRGLFPAKSDFHATSPDPVSAKVYEPFFRRWAERFARLRILQQGQINAYLLYIVLVVVLALAWVSVRTWWAAS
jgi:hydrogenase-4 component B